MLVDPKLMRFYGLMSGAVFTKIALMVGGFFLGTWIDKRLGTYPLFMLVLMLLGMSLGLWWIVRVATKNRDEAS